MAPSIRQIAASTQSHAAMIQLVMVLAMVMSKCRCENINTLASTVLAICDEDGIIIAELCQVTSCCYRGEVSEQESHSELMASNRSHAVLAKYQTLQSAIAGTRMKSD
ncbi:uncharacterized protein L3040_006750 [Drepanopeziza brunnea f. sp. 'multigermtubi']|uniref:uncharacterized protein n=1 Tax=Drepanopeziza brunnea f. sp. 'multigermtubi' TaxID=698441 RepID=UPI0023962003|nr:hypothetical protein L3040_006750 [Drepanopeziza brunnea f. sp. 'multigermtubi']